MTTLLRLVTFSLLTYGLVGCAGTSYLQQNNAQTIIGEVAAIDTMTYSSGLDGIGTLYIGAFPTCNLGIPPTGIFAQQNSDLSKNKRMPFTIENLPDGVYYLAAFLDETNSPPSPKTRPAIGDMVYAPTGVGDMKLDCVKVMVPSAKDNALIIPLTGRRP